MLTILVSVAAGIVLILIVLLVLRSRRRKNASPLSIVLLRSSPRRLSEADIRSIFRRAVKQEPHIQRLPELPNAKELSGFLVVSDHTPPLAVIDAHRPYAEKHELEETAANHDHPVLRNAIMNHAAWVSIDAMGINAAEPKETRNQVYALLAPIAAELYDDTCMLLYLPAEDRVAEPGERAERLLREGNIAELFSDADLHAPLFQIEQTDEAINAAMREARMRLPEFCSAFDRLGRSSEGLFKAGFDTGEPDGDSTEYIWCKAQALAPAGLTGVVLNHAVSPAVPPKDSVVTVRLEDVADWAYIDEHKQPHGMFVERVLHARKR